VTSEELASVNVVFSTATVPLSFSNKFSNSKESPAIPAMVTTEAPAEEIDEDGIMSSDNMGSWESLTSEERTSGANVAMDDFSRNMAKS
jgi:hypothetical protein